MHEIETWIEEAAQHKSILIRKLPMEEAISVQREVISRYVKTSSPSTWWWNLARPIDEHYDRNSVKLASVIPIKSGACWLIPDTEAQWLPVYEIDAGQVEKIIDDCPGFEYYVVAKDFSWFLVETHHDEYYLCRDSDKLPAIIE